jgi:membrane-associated phospholipid phosphatase
LRELLFVLGVTSAYFLTRGLIRGRAADAFANAQLILSLEHTLHLEPEYMLQTFAIQHAWLMQAANAFYIVGHLPVLIMTAIWLYFKHPVAYLQIRTAFLLSAFLGLSIYVTFPVAPPRFLPGFVDTLKVSGLNVDGSVVGALYNPYAAMPSLHVGWALLAGMALLGYARRRWLRVIGGLLPVLMTLTVIITGNHYLLDAVAGAVVVLVSLICSTFWYSCRILPKQPAVELKTANRQLDEDKIVGHRI